MLYRNILYRIETRYEQLERPATSDPLINTALMQLSVRAENDISRPYSATLG